MTSSDPTIKRVLLDEGARDYSLTRRILRKLPDVPVHARERRSDTADVPAASDTGKESLHLFPYKGEFLKPCPGTKGYICCGYQILNLATNCPLDCSYCILQSYFNETDLRVFANVEEQLAAVLEFVDRHPGKIFRIGTGEFTDSLALDPLTGWSDILLRPFSIRQNTALEFKTKTDRIEGLLRSPYRERIVVSWSLNSPYIASHEERKAPSLGKRLEAARRCQSEGFMLGFHFDPLILHPGWKEGYSKTLELMDRCLDPKKIAWISLGSIRFVPALKGIIRARHPQSCVLDGEFITGRDGKLRYFRPLRTDLYAFMRERLEEWHDRLGLYLCMESDEVWRQSMGWSPKDSNGLSAYLDERVSEIFR